MKKAYLLLLPVILILSACQSVAFGYTNSSHEGGWDYSYVSSSSVSYSYRSNDSLNNTGLNKAEMTFVNIDQSSTNISDVEKIKSFINMDQDILESIANPYYFSTKENAYVFLGVESSYITGEITFNFTQDIKNIEITAKPYNYEKVIVEGSSFVVDENVALSVNNSGFIKLERNINVEERSVASSTCSFALSTPSKAIRLQAGANRAILEKIVLYY